MLGIRLDRFSAHAGTHTVFDGIVGSIAWRADRVIGLMGPSGSGKTTLMRAILAARYLRRICGLSILPPDAEIAYVPQTPVLFSNLSILANARLFETAGRHRRRFDPSLFIKLANTLRLDHVLERRNVDRLSGGEAQRLMLLRTLSVRPNLILLDEPASGLDPAVREAFLVDLRALLEELDIRAMYVTHHWEEAAFLACKIAYLEGDISCPMTVRSINVSSTEEFFKRPPTVAAYQTVHGLGCSIWPVDEQNRIRFVIDGVEDSLLGRVACFPPGGGNANFTRHGSNFRLSNPVKTKLAAGLSLKATLYQDGAFAGELDTFNVG